MRSVRDSDAGALTASAAHRIANVPAARRTLASIIGLALIGSALLYYPTTGYGFNYDDYHWVRPYSLHEVLASFWGTWDSTHIEAPFYRPLTVTLYASRFLIFGYHASAYHWASIILFALAAALFGTFLYRLFHRATLALAGTALFLVHPAMTDTLVAWTINQYQMSEILLFLCALHWWLTCKDRRLFWWTPLFVLQLLCFLFKEDGIMLLIAPFLIHTAYQVVFQRRHAIPRMVYGIGCAMLVGLVVLRYAALRGGVGGYGVPPFHTVLRNLLLGPRLLLLGLYGDEPWSRGVSATLVTAMSIIGVAIAFFRHIARARFLVVCGVAILVCFDLPNALVGRTERHFLPLHFLTLGHVFILLGAADALWQSAMHLRTRRLFTLVTVYCLALAVFVGLLCFQPRLRDTYTPAQLNAAHDGTFYLTETDTAGNMYGWTKAQSSFALSFLPRKPVTLTTEIRSAAVAGGPDAPVQVFANGQEVGQLRPDPRSIAFQPLPIRFTPPSSEIGTLEIVFVTPTFRPPADKRDLGTMIRSVGIDSTEAWSGITRRLWLYWALPFFAIAALGLQWKAQRDRSLLAWYGAVAACVGGVGCMAIMLALFLRAGTLDGARYRAWEWGCVYLGIAFAIEAACVLRALPDGAGLQPSNDHWPLSRRFALLGGSTILQSAVGALLVFCVIVAAMNMAYMVRQNSREWSPYSIETVRLDRVARLWGDKVPPELRHVLAQKVRAHDDT